jgi:hypothetical protein
MNEVTLKCGKVFYLALKIEQFKRISVHKNKW